MEIEIKDAGFDTGSWITTNIDKKDVWFDASGVGWDIEYVARYEALRASISGRLTCAWDDGYDESRKLWTGIANCWPAAMAQCLKAKDTEACLAFAKKYDLPIMIRVAGEALAGQTFNNGALVIDVSLI